AFRYCQPDLGHALAAVAIAAALASRRSSIVPDWPHEQIAALAGIDRDQDYVDAEHEEVGCVLSVVRSHESFDAGPIAMIDRDARGDAARGGTWPGRASPFSEDH